MAEAVPRAPDRRRALDAFDDRTLADRVPESGPRAALAVLVGTAAEPLVAEVAAGRAPAVRYGALAEPSRVVGADPGRPDGGLVNDRYRAEHPALVSGSLVHALLAGPPPRGHAQEALLHGLLAAVHLHVLARTPRLAALGTSWRGARTRSPCRCSTRARPARRPSG